MDELLGSSKTSFRPLRRILVIVLELGLLLALVSVRGPLMARAKGAARNLDGRLGSHAVAWIYGERIPTALPPSPPGSYDWLKQAGPFIPIAHGLGPQLYAGPNGIGTLDRAAAQGFHIFELDLILTPDGHLICHHGPNNVRLDDAITFPDYLQNMRQADLPPLEFTGLIAWARTHPGTYFVLDVKNRFYDTYRFIAAHVSDAAMRRRLIPQAYSFEELSFLRQNHLFAGEIFTCYLSHLSTRSILIAAQRLGLPVVTLPREREQLLTSLPKGIAILVHPVDDPFDAAQLRRRGVRGIYTSYVSPATTPEIYADWTATCQPGIRWSQCSFLQ